MLDPYCRAIARVRLPDGCQTVAPNVMKSSGRSDPNTAVRRTGHGMTEENGRTRRLRGGCGAHADARSVLLHGHCSNLGADQIASD